MLTAPKECTATRFETVPGLRRVHLFQLCLKVVTLSVAAYVLVELVSGRPIYPVAPLVWAALVLMTCFVCRARVAWGTAVVFQDSAIVFFRRSSPVSLLQRNTIQGVRCAKHSLIFRYQTDLGFRRKLIGSEGFPKGVWLALSEHAAHYGAPAKNT